MDLKGTPSAPLWLWDGPAILLAYGFLTPDLQEQHSYSDLRFAFWLSSLRIWVLLFRLNYINTGELVTVQFTIPEHINETDKAVTANNRQLELHWTKFIDK